MKLIAHRGDITTAKENTMEAFENTVNAGADGFEFDVRLTADDVPVVYHNMMLDTDTENGFVEDYTFEQIQQLQMTVDGVAYLIPSFDEVLDAFCGKTYLEIHVQDYKRATIQAIGERLLPYRQYWAMCEITSFDTMMLQGFREKCDTIACDYITHKADWMTTEMMIRLAIEKATLANASGVHLPYQYVTPANVKRFQDAGLYVHCGVLNDSSKLSDIQAIGIELFLTDNIHLFLDKIP